MARASCCSLFRSCAESGETHACTHTSLEDRVLIGTWTSKAVECGYKILQRIEAWHYPNTSQYDPETHTGGIWAAFINKWVEAGGLRLSQRVRHTRREVRVRGSIETERGHRVGAGEKNTQPRSQVSGQAVGEQPLG